MKLEMESITSFLKMNRRVLQIAKRPDRDEYYNVARITGLGILVIGVVGFAVTMIFQLLNLK